MAKDSTSIKDKIREYLQSTVPHVEFDDDTAILENGYVTSLIAMQLVLFVESEFGISIGDDDLNRENFSSIISVTQLVEKLKV